MKHKHNAGFSLVEVLVAIAVLAILFVPTCTSLVTSMNLNAGTEAMMQAEFNVSSTVEILMAEGIPNNVLEEADQVTVEDDRFENVSVTVAKSESDHYYLVTVTSTEVNSVVVTTRIRGVEPVAEEEGTT